MSPAFNQIWTQKLSQIIQFGHMSGPRGFKTYELLNSSVHFPANKCLLTVPERKLGYRFAMAEAWWILSSRKDVESIAPYSKAISKFSDDGVEFFGAYGPKIRSQIDGVVDALVNDSQTRQAVITIWRENPPKTKDVPCTVSLQFLIRSGSIHLIANMRSSDIWLGLPYDAFNFACLLNYVRLLISQRIKNGFSVENPHWITPDLGRVYVNAGSQHLYAHDFRNALGIPIADRPDRSPFVSNLFFQGEYEKDPDIFIEVLGILKDITHQHIPLTIFSQQTMHEIVLQAKEIRDAES